MEQNGHLSAVERSPQATDFLKKTYFDTLTINYRLYCSRYIPKLQYICEKNIEISPKFYEKPKITRFILQKSPIFAKNLRFSLICSRFLNFSHSQKIAETGKVKSKTAKDRLPRATENKRQPTTAKTGTQTTSLARSALPSALPSAHTVCTPSYGHRQSL